MFYSIFVVLLSKFVFANSNSTEVKIKVVNYHDYWVYLNNTNDRLIIELPENSLFFISALSGYEAVIYDRGIVGYDPLSKKLIPNPRDRLVYFKDDGYINVTSTVDNLNFTFHTLCLDKIKVQYDHLIISSDPYESFNLKYNPSEREYSHAGNSTFQYSHLIWQIGDNFTRCEIVPYVIKSYNPSNYYYEQFLHPTHFSFPFFDSDNNSDIIFTDIYIIPPDIGQYMNSNSKLIYIEKELAIKNSHVYYTCRPLNTVYDYYTGYRAVFNVSELQKLKRTSIISRGSNHINFTNIVDNSDEKNGIIEIDFSINNKFMFENEYKLIIFPTTSQIKFSSFFNDSLLGIISFSSPLTIESGSLNEIDDSVINLKAIYYDYYKGYRNAYFIISTSPTEILKIGTFDSNYSQYREHVYIMASLQDISTNVTFNGPITFKSIKFGKIENINYDNSTNTIVISGPFIAHIPIETICEFTTKPNGNLKEGFVDDGRVYFRNSYNDDGFLSKKYGFYKNISLHKTDINISFNDANSCLVKASPMVYSPTDSNWYGEVIVPTLKDNKIGPHLNRSSFYISGSGVKFIYIMLTKIDPNFDKFDLHLRTAPIENLINYNDIFVDCSRMIVFNEIPTKFSFNHKPNKEYKRIDIDTNEIVCMFPAVSYYYFATTCADDFGTNGQRHITYVQSEWDGKRASTWYQGIKETSYCPNVSYYNYYGYYGYTIIRYSTLNRDFKEISSFIYVETDTHNETTSIIAPDEPLFYSDFLINKTFGIHSFGENIYQKLPENGDDDDGDNDNKKEDISITLNNRNSHEIVDMKNIKKLTINVPKSTLFFINYISGYKATVYRLNPKMRITKVSEEDSIKILNFDEINGEIVVEKDQDYSKSLLNSDKEEFAYSYVVLDDILSGESKCDKIFISTKLLSVFYIKESDNDEVEFNYSLSNTNNFCLWFPFQFYSSVVSYSYLSHSQLILLDGNLEEMESTKNSKSGYNFFYLLKNTTSQSSGDHKYAKYISSVDTDKPYTQFLHHKQVNSIFAINSNEYILKEISSSDEKSVQPKEAKKKFKLIPFIACACILVAIIIIIIIIVVYVKKSKKQVSNSGDKSENELNSNP